MRSEDRYLHKRGRRWHYVRRVPGAYRQADPRGAVRVSLGTTNLEIARSRRDAMEQADDEYWACLLALAGGDAGDGASARARDAIARRYKAANARAVARGFAYVPIGQLVAEASLEELVERVNSVAAASRKEAGPAAFEAEALLGTAPMPPVTLSQAFETYCKEIAVGELLAKSPNQERLWMKTKRRAVGYFIDLLGDKPIADITREDALKFYNWWAERLKPKKGGSAKRPNTANRDIGNLRLLHDRYFKHLGEEGRPNPFRNLVFKETTKAEVPPFPDQWVRERILTRSALEGINDQARLIAYALIETGCRPSEIANLTAEDICLGADVPHIQIRPRKGMEIKTRSSIREIPLVGVSLEAMKRAPNGFPHYRDRNDLLSQSLVKAFRNRDLMPSEAHVIYSFRHSFEKRMLEAGLDYGLRCLLMGHATNRPAYGDGGSLAYRRDELLKIAHPFPDGMFDGPARPPAPGRGRKPKGQGGSSRRGR